MGDQLEAPWGNPSDLQSDTESVIWKSARQNLVDAVGIADDGSIVGVVDGSTVDGTLVEGREVGNCVGRLVGSDVGTLVGFLVGIGLVGELVGDTVHLIAPPDPDPSSEPYSPA